jgi:hypothetical protein
VHGAEIILSSLTLQIYNEDNVTKNGKGYNHLVNSCTSMASC